MKNDTYTTATRNEVTKLKLLAALPEKTNMKPARKLLSDEEAQALISTMIEQGLPLQGARKTH